jgi:hypothetical protein
VFGSDDWSGDVKALAALIGPPSALQDGVWAQFDHGGARVAIGASADVPEPSLMLKVGNLDEAKATLESVGFEVNEPVVGQHEIQIRARRPGGLSVVAYVPIDQTPLPG